MLIRLLLCVLLGVSLAACEPAPPPPPPVAPVHVDGFPVGHPLNPAPAPDATTAKQSPPVPVTNDDSASHSFSGPYVGMSVGGASGDSTVSNDN